ERSHHDTAVAELNSSVRKINVLMPYSLRCPYYPWDTKAYEDCGDDILHGISGRRREIHGRSGVSSLPEFDRSMPYPLGFRDIIHRRFMKLRDRSTMS
ncbi:hypothetical protein EDB19DRAFT_1643928, partial [Suillus lakei]